jgi:hypothetical protein
MHSNSRKVPGSIAELKQKFDHHSQLISTVWIILSKEPGELVKQLLLKIAFF